MATRFGCQHPREVPAALRDLLSGRHPAGPSEIEFPRADTGTSRTSSADTFPFTVLNIVTSFGQRREHPHPRNTNSPTTRRQVEVARVRRRGCPLRCQGSGIRTRPPSPLGTRNPAVRVVYDARHGALAGIGRFAIDLWRAMREVESEAIAITQAKHRAGWLGPQEQVLPPPTVSVRSGPFSPSDLVILPWLLHRERAQVFHSPHFNIPLVRRIPTVITVHDLY